LTYRKWLDENQLDQQNRLRDILLTYPPGEEEDKPLWNFLNMQQFENIHY
jgi:hypothetical protein